jgi:hypothetical protein
MQLIVVCGRRGSNEYNRFVVSLKDMMMDGGGGLAGG